MSSMKYKSSSFPQHLKTFLGFYLNKAALVSTKRVDEALQPFGLRIKHYAVLQYLNEFEPAQQKAIGDVLMIDRNSMVRLVDDLEKQNLVHRMHDPHDRRAYAVSITEVGRTQLRQLSSVVHKAEDDVMKGLNEEEKTQLEHLLIKLLDEA